MSAPGGATPRTPRLRASLAIGAAVPQGLPDGWQRRATGTGTVSAAVADRWKLRGRRIGFWMIPNDFVLRFSA
jgi:hypothetical protein